MSDFNRSAARAIPIGGADMAVDAGLRAFMLGVYNKLALGLILSAALAYLTSSVPAARDLLFMVKIGPDGLHHIGFTMLGMVVAFAPLAVMLFATFGLRNATPRSANIVYWTIVALIGAGLGVWMLAYTGVSVASTFFVTATAFGGLSLVGYTTKKDLSGFGSFLIMALFGLILASIVSAFVHSSALLFMINVAGVLIFSGLIAYNTQRLKMTYYQLGGDQAAMGVATSYGALSLYLDFINLFQFLLSFMGNRR